MSVRRRRILRQRFDPQFKRSIEGAPGPIRYPWMNSEQALMDRMFLKDVEEHNGDNNYTRAIDMMRRAGPEYPQILHMFSYKMNATVHLERFTQEMLREAAPLSPGIRELIAAYTSHLNQCPF
jgi:hypothetical protein